MSKKSRGPNFSSNEKEIIIHLVNKYKDIVENKRTDAVSTATKNQGWINLTKEFNSISSYCNRSSDQLKTCWDNIKRSTRKEKAAAKKELFLTGGGRSNTITSTPLQSQVESLLGPTLDGLDNIYDSDGRFLEENINVDVEVVVTETDDENIMLDHQYFEPQKAQVSKENLPPDNTDNTNWKSWTPATLKTKVSNPLKHQTKKDSPLWLQRRRPKSSLQDKVLEKKIELIELLKINSQREADLKFKLLEEQIKQEELKSQILKSELDKKCIP